MNKRVLIAGIGMFAMAIAASVSASEDFEAVTATEVSPVHASMYGEVDNERNDFGLFVNKDNYGVFIESEGGQVGGGVFYTYHPLLSIELYSQENGQSDGDTLNRIAFYGDLGNGFGYRIRVKDENTEVDPMLTYNYEFGALGFDASVEKYVDDPVKSNANIEAIAGIGYQLFDVNARAYYSYHDNDVADEAGIEFTYYVDKNVKSYYTIKRFQDNHTESVLGAAYTF